MTIVQTRIMNTNNILKCKIISVKDIKQRSNIANIQNFEFSNLFLSPYPLEQPCLEMDQIGRKNETLAEIQRKRKTSSYGFLGRIKTAKLFLLIVFCFLIMHFSYFIM